MGNQEELDLAEKTKARVKEKQISKMVDRFLSWPLPKDFAPDNNISFRFPDRSDQWPVGTNLFTADQARKMIEHILETV